MEEPRISDPPLGISLMLIFGFWAGWGTLIWRWLALMHWLIRLPAAVMGGYMLMIFSLAILFPLCRWWHRPMTPEERAEWERENAERAARIRAAREEQKELRKAREQARANSIATLKNFLSSLEEDPQAAKLLARLHAGPVDRGTVNRALANPDIVLAGIGSWLKRRGRYNNLPDVGFPKSLGKGEVEGPLDDLFDQLKPKERNAFLDILSQGAELAEEALAQGVSQREILELLLPLILS